MPELAPKSPLYHADPTASDALFQIVGSILPATERPTHTLQELRGSIFGSDDAVVETGDAYTQSSVQTIVSNAGPFSRDELRQAVAANYSGEAYGDFQWQKQTDGWGGAPVEELVYGAFRRLYPGLKQLSLDLGFMTHLPTFLKETPKGMVGETDFEVAREAFSKQLGRQTLWRGMMLTDDELATTQESGILSHLARAAETSHQPKRLFEAHALSTMSSRAIEAHFHRQLPMSSFISISDYPDLAIAVGCHFGAQKGKEFYLFEVCAPQLDVISFADHAVKAPPSVSDRLRRNPDAGVFITIDGATTNYPWSGGVERFIPWKINPDEIVSITQPTLIESIWNGRKTSWVSPELIDKQA